MPAHAVPERVGRARQRLSLSSRLRRPAARTPSKARREAAPSSRSPLPRAPTNVAKCITTSGITQSCSITQKGTGSNTAIVVEIVTKTSGLTQNASQTAQIVQTAGSGANTACVLQKTTIDGSTVAKKDAPVNVTLDAHQSISITQDSASGGNAVQERKQQRELFLRPARPVADAHVHGHRIREHHAAPERGRQRAEHGARHQAEPKPGFFGSASGPNNAAFTQTNTLTAVAVTPAGPVSQTQSSATAGSSPT